MAFSINPIDGHDLANNQMVSDDQTRQDDAVLAINFIRIILGLIHQSQGGVF